MDHRSIMAWSHKSPRFRIFIDIYPRVYSKRFRISNVVKSNDDRNPLNVKSLQKLCPVSGLTLLSYEQEAVLIVSGD